MGKYTRSRHVPLVTEEAKVLDEELEQFIAHNQEAGTVLRGLRQKNKWSLSDLAREVGVDKKHLVEMEQGLQPIPEHLAKRFAELFHISVHVFQ